MRSRPALSAAACAASLALVVGCGRAEAPETTVVTSPAPRPTSTAAPAGPGPTSTAATSGADPTGGPGPTTSDPAADATAQSAPPIRTAPATIPVPTPPPDMARNDETGAIAAATYFITELYPYVIATSDVSTWTTMSDPTCNFCKSVEKDISGFRDSGQTVELAPIRLTDPFAEKLNSGVFQVGFEIATGPDEYFSQDGLLVRTSPVVTGGVGFHVRRDAEQWTVVGVNLVPDNEGAR